jgi:predicted RNase H-like nuclease (RuvC/YqgF family)
MNPESVTTGQLISSFTAKHWVAVIATTFSALGSIGYGGYWLGKSLTESQAAAQQAELRGSLAQSQAKLEVNQNRVEQLTAQLPQWQSAYQKLQTELAQQQQTITSLNSQLGRANNCAFIHEQIIATQKLIENPNGIFVFPPSKEEKEKELERTSSLQHRLEGYQQQLSTCNK